MVFAEAHVLQLRLLKKDVRRSKRNAFAAGTNANLRTQWRAYFLFCAFFHINAIPCTLEVIGLFAQFLSRSFQSLGAIKNYLHGLKVLHLSCGLEFPHLERYEIKLLLRGIAKLNPHTPRQPLPITPPILARILEVLDLSLPLHASLWCCFVLSFFLFARKSNMVPPSRFSFDGKKHLRRGDVLQCQAGLLVHFKWSKTIQHGERRLLIPLAANSDSPLCPRKAFLNMCRVVPAAKSGPAFLVPGESGLVTLTHTSLVTYLRQVLQKVGFNPRAFSGHSFRRGGATWAFKCGVPGELIRLHGDWKSASYLRYLEFSTETKMGVSAALYRDPFA